MVTPTSMNFDTTGTLTYSLGGNATHDQDPNEAHEKKLRMIIYVLDGYVTFIFITLGVSLNSLSMMVFNQMNRGKSSIAQYYLMILLICQSALLCNCFLMYCLPTMIHGDTQIPGSYSLVILLAHALSGPFYVSITWIVLALTIERYFALCNPLKYRAFATKSRVKRILFGVLIAAFLFTLPRLFEYRPATICTNDNTTSSHLPNTSPNNCYLTLVSTEFFQSEIYWTVYHIYMVMVFVTVTPSIIILTLTFRITCFLRTARRERQNLRGSEQSERKTLSSSSKEEREPNIMIIMIAAKFALSDPLPMIESLIGAVAPEESPAMLALFASVGNLLVIFCNSVNFFLFYASGHRFRTECRKMFCIEEPKTPSWFESDESWRSRSTAKSIDLTDVSIGKCSTVSTLPTPGRDTLLSSKQKEHFVYV